MTRRAGEIDDAIVVDWSAASSPTTGPDSCWVAWGSLREPGPLRTTNAATRHEAVGIIERLIERSLLAKRRVLVALDVSFGLPYGAAATLRLGRGPGWRRLWSTLEARIVDDASNANNRFAVADALNEEAGVRCFWGRPISAAYEVYRHLPVRNVDVEGLARNPLPAFRRCELLAGPGVISNWMLVGKGAVGGQMLTCVPYLERLRGRWGGQLAVWPFDGIGDPMADVVLAETWHGLFAWRAERDRIRDQAQVRATLRALRGAGVEGRAGMLAPASLLALSSRAKREIVAEEGWTLGIP